MYALSRAVPRLKLVWAHFSGYGGLEAHIDMLKSFPNVYFDISAHGTDLVGTLRKAIDCVGYDRLLFGTDYPMWDHKGEYERFNRLNLTDAEREKILYQNAETLLHLDKSAEN